MELAKYKKLRIKRLVLGISLLILGQTINASELQKTAGALSAGVALAAGAGLVSLIKYLRTPDRSMPTFEKLNAVTILPTGYQAGPQIAKDKKDVLKVLKQQKGFISVNGELHSVQAGIPMCLKHYNGPISIYSGGYSNGGNPYAYSGYVAQQAGTVPGAIVTFEFPHDTRAGFNFCQEQDQICPQLICQEIVKIKPDAHIILHGACKGGANNLTFMASAATKLKAATAEQINHNPELSLLSRLVHHNIKAVVSESPPRRAVDGVKNQLGGYFVPYAMRAIFPNYDHKAPLIMEAKYFPDIPIFLASLPKDSISVLDEIKEMVKHVNNVRGSEDSSIQHFVSQESELRHGRIGKAKDYQVAVNAFYRDHNLLPNQMPVNHDSK